MKKEMTNGILRCPLCRTSKFLVIRNCGFVNCEWSMRGVLRQNRESKIYADGRTYDGKLYTFKECNYEKIFLSHLFKKTLIKVIRNKDYCQPLAHSKIMIFLFQYGLHQLQLLF